MKGEFFRSGAACLISVLAAACSMSGGQDEGQGRAEGIKTTFQTSREWTPAIDVRADAVMVYGFGGNPSDPSGRMPFEERAESWRRRGYAVHFMTGIAWGEYQDYFTGGRDGSSHRDEGQMTAEGDTIWHGPSVPYIVPTAGYLEYIKDNIRRVIDAGISDIFLEEPEFWARAGYSAAFRQEWKEFYGTEWKPQHESPENTYLSNKLKYHLYLRALDEVFSFAKEYGKSKGKEIGCYVPTHSLINYSQWQIVSPEASLASLDCVDGYIAQVWTGTSRVKNWYDGKEAERVFETAFLEYGSMESMTAPTGRKMFFLTDPIEDRAVDWDDYRRNYQATFTAQLLYPEIASYEIMPWPERIFGGRYRISGEGTGEAGISEDYAAQILIMTGALQNMPGITPEVNAARNGYSGTASGPDGTAGISVLMGNSLMFQTFPAHDGYTDPQLSNFFGLAMPFLKRGVPVRTVHIENLGYEDALKDTGILLMTYANMKPLDSLAHRHLAEWVKDGGILLYSGRDDDPFQNVREWWNTGGNGFKAPSGHLFSLMGMPAEADEGEYRFGKGKVRVMRRDPKEYVLVPGGDGKMVSEVCRLYKDATGGKEIIFKNSFSLVRGPYAIASVMTESVSDNPLVIKGNFIDLFDPDLPVVTEKIVMPGEQCLLYDLDLAEKDKPQIAAASFRAYGEKYRNGTFSFTAKGPAGTRGIARIILPKEPEKATAGNEEALFDWDNGSSSVLIEFDNSPDGVKVSLR